LQTHNWRVSKIAVLVLCGALVLLAGCATTPSVPPSDWLGTNQVQVAEAPSVPKLVLPAMQTNLPALAKTNLPPALKTDLPLPALLLAINTNLPPAPITNIAGGTNVIKPRPAPVSTFSSLNRWAVEQKIPPPRLLAKSPLVTYAVSSAKGVMVLAIGSREAAWNGVTLHLGFAPEIVDGEVYLHGLDLQKTLEPLLCVPVVLSSASRVIVIDPGHGGAEGGTISVWDHRAEKEFTLDWARRLGPLLEQEGWHVFFTRTNDTYLALSNRVAMAESVHADLFVSLHFNSVAHDQKPNGLATFCLTPAGMPSDETRGYADIWSQYFPNNAYDTQNLQLAERLHRSLLRTAHLEDHGVNRSRFMGVLRGQRRPAVLIEGGFLSNPHEAKRIESADFRQKLAEAVADALK